ncbi:ATP-dependent nuclease [Aureivirga marina]|uniref:ATP-dependent nuclease n=1 Tax=Aureivirga marina TaxID=1182451 RepID=UPI0018CBE8E3|nr:AAA family ATPase [Aureivirga marina]
MSRIRIKQLEIKNYRSFKEYQIFKFPNEEYKKPVAIIGYNNSGKTNLMNSILYGLQVNFVSKDAFSLDDFHNRDIDNIPQITLKAESSRERKFDGIKYASLTGYHRLKIFTDGNEIEGSKIESLNQLNKIVRRGEEVDDINWDAFGATKYFNIFYINFHNIKEEISTQKTSWGNLKSFLAKHIKKIVDSDIVMDDKKNQFHQEINDSTNNVIKDSELEKFIKLIQKNYMINLRNDDCNIDFGLPNYEDIFLKMLFKVGLNGNKSNLVPIDHFGDGYISMFVMAVIQAIAESSSDDENCLFLFEEPESFLHENHQEYFYKTVLCNLAEKGHQVIYTTHSDKMIDPFDTKGIIRLEMDENNQTVKKYNDIGEFKYENIISSNSELSDEPINMFRFNEFIKTVEPNLSRMLFSKKVILVEGPNDVLVYNHIIKEKVKEIIQNDDSIQNIEKYADTYLNFENISIVCHHGKATAYYIIELCEHFEIDYYVITDWDFEERELSIDQVKNFDSLEDLQSNEIYTSKESTIKGMITTNRKLIDMVDENNLHFNIKKLEKVIDYNSDSKNSFAIWNLIKDENFNFDERLFPISLENFIGLDKLREKYIVIDEEVEVDKTKV